MLNAYRAVLKGDKLEWSETPPPDVANGGVPVVVVLLTEGDAATQSRGERMAAALAQLASSGGATSFSDPLAWQREVRSDRPLYDRDEP